MNNSIERSPGIKVLIPGLLLLCLFLLACAAVTGLPVSKEPAATHFGPEYTPQERQARTLDAIWA